MITIVATRELKIGERYHEVVRGPHCEPILLGFRVVREATEAEYRATLEEFGVSDDIPFFHPVTFYLIAED